MKVTLPNDIVIEGNVNEVKEILKELGAFEMFLELHVENESELLKELTELQRKQ